MYMNGDMEKMADWFYSKLIGCLTSESVQS